MHTPPSTGDNAPTWLGHIYTAQAGATEPVPLADRAPWLNVIAAQVENMPAPIVPADIIGYPSAGGGWTMAALRGELLLATTPLAVRDAAWGYVVGQVRDRQPGWTYFAFGLAMPGLWTSAFTLAPKGTPMPEVFLAHRRLATEFVLAIDTFNVDRPHILARLLDNARYAAAGHRHRQPTPPSIPLDAVDRLQNGDTAVAARLPAPARERHPLIALIRLVELTASQKPAQRFTARDAELIFYIDLEGHTVAETARMLGLPEPATRMRHFRARHHIARLLHHETGRRDI